MSLATKVGLRTGEQANVNVAWVNVKKRGLSERAFTQEANSYSTQREKDCK